MKKSFIFLILIIALASFLRVYKMENLAIFLADQASDSTKVYKITKGHFTLLGPITSVGGFFNGPIVYYLMLPFYFFLKGEPISGTVFQTFFQILTIPFIFLLGKRLKNETVGLIASFIFAVSPLMIDYSRAGFNAHPAIFFSTLVYYVFVLLIDKFSILKGIMLGILLGFIFQMHYLTISTILFVFLYPLIFKKDFISIKYYLSIVIGILLGLSPFLLFELRHNFLNTTLFLRYLTSGKTYAWSIIPAFDIWPKTVSKLIFGNYLIAIIIIFFTLISLFINRVKETNKYLFLILIVFLISIIYGKPLEKHYIIVSHIPLILLFSLGVYLLLRKNKIIILLFLLFIFLFNLPRFNLDKDKHPIQKGMAITDFKKVAEIISNDKKTVYNVAMHTQGDNRAMPIRYMLLLLNEKPLDFEHYGEANTLYFLIPNNKTIKEQTMWEYTSFGSSNITNKWKINNQYDLYRLDKY